MSKPADGPAFPWSNDVKEYPGMMLRDYFAAKAMQSMNMSREEAGRQGFGYESVQSIATRAYQIADAMLAERAK